MMRKSFSQLVERVRVFFTAPMLPPTAVAVRSREIAVVEARWKRGRLFVRRAAVEPLAEGVLEPAFEGKNVRAREPLRRALERAREKAGVRHARRWAVALPSAICRLFLLDVEEAPKAKGELASMLAWKIERLVGLSASELTIAAQRLPVRSRGTSADARSSEREIAPRRERFLAVAARTDVLAAYEEVLGEAGFHAGFLVPNNLAESGWMATLPSDEDALLISVEGDWLTLLFTRHRDPLAVRAVHCEPEAMLDEIHRTLVYYQDRLCCWESELPLAESTPSEAESHAPTSERGARLRAIVVINHNEEAEGMPSAFAREIEALCAALFPRDVAPMVYPLNEHALEQEMQWRLSHLAAPLGMIVSSRTWA
jgi:hypothetical protein